MATVTLLDRYDDPALSCIVQPVHFTKPWVVLPVISDFRHELSTRRNIPVVNWVIEGWENDLREELTSYLRLIVGKDVGNQIRNLPASFVSILYRNLFTNMREESVSVVMTRLDHELIGAVHAISAYWVGYHLAGYLMESYLTATDNEGRYRYKLLYDLQTVIGTMLGRTLTDNPTVAKDPHLIICNTESLSEKQTLFVDRALLQTYLNAGNTIKQLCDNWVNTQTNPLP